MFGLKAVNYYMIVERDRWMGSPVTADNQIRQEPFDFYRQWNGFLSQPASTNGPAKRSFDPRHYDVEGP